MAFTLSDLRPSDQRLLTVQLHDSVEHAISLMNHHDFNQVPVVGNNGESLDKVVTFDSIVQAIQAFATRPESLLVRDVARGVRSYASDADLLTTLDDIQRDNFALIVDDENKLIGIVTTADTAVFFQEYAQDLMLIEGIESHVKEAIQLLYGGQDGELESAIEAVCDRTGEVRKKLPAAVRAYLGKMGSQIPKTGTDLEALSEAEKKLGLLEFDKQFPDLSFDEYTHVLLRHPNAPKLSQSKDVTELRRLLEKVRDARNKLAHFRGELTLEERRTIRFASEWLEGNLPVAKATAPAARVSTISNESIGVDREEEETEPQGSYAPFSKYLRDQAPDKDLVETTFQQLEAILGKQLPRSAYEYRAWWSNDPAKPQSAAWLEEGWRTTSINMTERRLTFVRTNEREEAYIRFFSSLNARLKGQADFPSREMSPQGQSWIILATLRADGQEFAHVLASFSRRKELRIELYLDNQDKEANKRRFDVLLAKKDDIEGAVGEPLQWNRLDAKRACRIAASTKAQVLLDADKESLLDWAVQKAKAIYKGFAPEFR
jgi:hypothetical protein